MVPSACAGDDDARLRILGHLQESMPDILLQHSHKRRLPGQSSELEMSFLGVLWKSAAKYLPPPNHSLPFHVPIDRQMVHC
jgi:hypothetical protein